MPDVPDSPVAELRGVARRYEMGDGLVVTALEDASLTLSPGEFAVVLGPSGSGKTTLLNMIGALDSPTEGTVIIDGEDITGAGRSDLFRVRRHEVSFIFQTFNLFPALTALENGRHESSGLLAALVMAGPPPPPPPR